MSRRYVASVPARVAGAAAAALAVAAAALHLLAVGSMPWLLGAVMVVLAAACLTCVPSLLRGPTRGTWLVVAVMAGGMLALHAGAMALHAGGATPPAEANEHAGHAPHHEHDEASAASPVAGHLRAHLAGEGWDVMHVGSLVAGAELLLAAGAVALGRSAVGSPSAVRREARTTTPVH